ncbi:protein FAR1-RELATED SEQUENCE 5-like [Chenopodium quinoa]|uniref:protein FAR1-RELATED SEQUENCE 5-like n=1 Tax=Chenopodium quinoa TaxID=63459 RepID=UPI000B7877E7|nr:protein FAR1-RELATED SEQUENCE 5-like [Chenopodium quinoa]
MIFKDPEEGLSFYKAYANAAGFTSRKSTTTRKKNNKDIIAFQYGVCNKEGFKATKKPIAQQTVDEEGKVRITRKRLVTPVGCNAHICMRYDAGKYVVSQFKEEHNHCLYTPSCAKFQKDNRKMHIMHKKLIVDNSKVNVGPVRSYTMMKELAGSHDNVGASKQDFKNFYRDLKAYIAGSDAQIYNMIFGPFTGVDHHKKCVTFAASFVAHKDISSFEWVFKTFLKSMGNNDPVCLITDQDPAMKVVVRNVFQITEHRFCMWHIMKKVPEKVGRAITQETDFLKKVCACVWHLEIEPAEFEEKWNKVISEFNLNDHEWLAHMFNIRDMWIPAFECALDAQRHTQNKMDNDSKNKRPECKTPIPLEKDAPELFTTTIFYDFQYELEIGCFNCGVEEMKKDNEIYIFKLREGSRRRAFDVVFDPTTLDTKCFCKKFERDGVPCRHMIWMWKARMLEKIPKTYVLNRWCTMAYKKPIFDLEGNVLEECLNVVDKKMLLNDLWCEIYACVSLVQNNEDDLSDLVKKLRVMRIDLEQKKITNGSNNFCSKVKDIEMLIGASLPSEVLIKAPKISKNKGTGVHVPN